MPLRQAAISCGIPAAEALEHIKKVNLKPEEISFELKLLAERALRIGTNKLVQIAEDGPRYSDELTTVVSCDLTAAQTLVKLGIDVLKLSISQNPEAKGKLASAVVQLDLWDSQGAWELKKPGAD